MPRRSLSPGAPRRGHGSRALAAVVLTALALGVVVAPVAASRVASPVASGLVSEAATTKLRGDLVRLVAGTMAVDPRLPGLVPGYQPGELAAFAVLTTPLDAAHRAALTATGARIPRSYRTVDMVAIAARPSTIRAVAGLSWVAWLAPVDVIVAPGAQAAPIPTSGTGSRQVKLPGATRVNAAGDAIATFTATIPSSAPAGTYSGVVVATTDHGETIRIPVFASVALHDTSTAAGNAPGPQARIASARDVLAKGDTSWPSAVGTPGTDSNADWLVLPVNLATGLTSARFSVWDTDRGDETYDLYVYDASFDLIASTHPFAADGVTDVTANNGRGPTTAGSPGSLTLASPAGGRYYVAVSRAKVGGTTSGDMGSFVLTLDEVKAAH